jgi:hypothetical protein
MCYVCGTPFPWILRSRGDEAFTLIGDSWAAGLSSRDAMGMPQEIWDQLVPDDLWREYLEDGMEDIIDDGTEAEARSPIV